MDEALTNIIEHAYGGSPGQPIEVELAPVGEDSARALQIRLADRGRQVDPAEIKPRDLGDVRPGGLGVHIISENMDKVEFQPRHDGGTLLTMVKRIQTTDRNERKEVSS